MAQQTAIDWLADQLKKQGYLYDLDIQAAKQIEKEQIVKAHGGRSYSGFDSSGNFFIRQTTGEEYYNETYNK